MLTALVIVVGLVALGCRLFRGPLSRPWAAWAAAGGAYCTVMAARTGSSTGRASWLALAVAFALEVRRIVRAWHLIPARDSVTR